MVEKIVNKLIYLCSYIFTYILAKLNISMPLDKMVSTVDKSDIIISFTSYWKRFETVHYTLESLFRQKTDINFSVVLVLSQEDIDKFGGLPTKIDRYLKYGLTLKIVKENLKSYKKAFYTYDLGKPIITVDDDIFYPSWWLSKFYTNIKKNPDIILAYRGHYIIFENCQILPYVEWCKISDKKYINIPNETFLPTGTSGVYYPKESLKGLAESKDIFTKICFEADDLWFKYICLKNGYLSMRLFDRNYQFISFDDGETLYEKNVLGGANDIQFQKIIQFDPLFLSSIKKNLNL